MASPRMPLDRRGRAPRFPHPSPSLAHIQPLACRYIEKNFGKESLAKTVENWLPPLLKQMSEDGKLVNVNAGLCLCGSHRYFEVRNAQKNCNA